MAKPSEILRDQMNEAAAKNLSGEAKPNDIVSVFYGINTTALIEILATLERMEEKLGS
jgi:hypothetical protein